VEGVAFVAQSTAVTLGQATFRASGTTTATATSLAAQINAHATIIAAGITAEASNAIVTISAPPGADGNDVTLTYTDGGAEVGATVSGATLTGGLDDAFHSAALLTAIAGISTVFGADSGLRVFVSVGASPTQAQVIAALNAVIDQIRTSNVFS
jgi:hypothetical protein